MHKPHLPFPREGGREKGNNPQKEKKGRKGSLLRDRWLEFLVAQVEGRGGRRGVSILGNGFRLPSRKKGRRRTIEGKEERREGKAGKLLSNHKYYRGKEGQRNFFRAELRKKNRSLTINMLKKKER